MSRKNSKSKFFVVIIVSSFALLLFSILVEAQTPLSGGYPQLDVPPTPLPEWLSLVDLSKAPNAPVQAKAGGSCPTPDEFCNWSCTNCINADTDYKTCPEEKVWGISYDDGPSPYTPALLDHLKAKNVKATFFIVGSRVTENPDILKRTVAEGHQIGVHTWSHKPLTTQSNEAIIGEIKWTEKIIKDVTGLTPNFMRPPYGDIDNRVRYILKSLGYKVVIWDLDTNDWMTSDVPKDYETEWITGNFSLWVKDPKTATSGHISLEHDLYPLSAQEAIPSLDIVLGAGFKVEQVATCVSAPPYREYPGFPGDNTTTAAATTTSSPSTVPITSTSTSYQANVKTATPSSGISTPTPYSSSSSLLSSSSSLLNIFVVAIISTIFAFPFLFSQVE